MQARSLRVLSRDQIRAYDRCAIDDCFIPGAVLMENAGRGVVDWLVRRFDAATQFVIVAGSGNNGGDGYVVARHLLARGCPCRVLHVGREAEPGSDAATCAQSFAALGGEVDQFEPEAFLDGCARGSCVIVDSIFGTGLNRQVMGAPREAILALNTAVDASTTCVALDLPSGIDCDSGGVHGVAVIAEHTLTFAHHKAGLWQGEAAQHVGTIEVIDLGFPDERVLRSTGFGARVIDQSCLNAVAQRAPDGHKYRAGHVVVVGGAPTMLGAALLSARGAFRAGAGVVTVVAPHLDVSSSFAAVADLPEVMCRPVEHPDELDWVLEKASAVVVGPGLGRSSLARQLVERLWAEAQVPLVVDADALGMLGATMVSHPDDSSTARAPRVLTPHVGEFERLREARPFERTGDRIDEAAACAEAYGATVVLKGRGTVIARPGLPPRLCTAGHAALATAGSGDVLAGLCGGLLAAKSGRGDFTWERATALDGRVDAAVWIHARAGEVLAAQGGGILAREIADAAARFLGG